MSDLKLSIDLGENFADPSSFVECAVLAEEYGFYAVWFGDHFLPWFHSGMKSAYVWPVMSVALDRTKKIKIGVDVTSPIGGRYHPAIIAQAAATLDNMYPARFLLGVGSGEAVNEARFFHSLPGWRERTERLVESITLMKKLWYSEEYFTFEGKYFGLTDVFLYTKPKTRIPIYFSAIGKKAAAIAGTYGDNLVTFNSVERCKELIFPLFETSAREAGKEPSNMDKMVLLDWYPSEKDRGVRELKEKGEAGPLADGAFEEPDPRRIEAMSATVSDEKIFESKCLASTAEELIQAIDRYGKIGATHVDVVTGAFSDRIKLLGEKVLPYFADGSRR